MRFDWAKNLEGRFLTSVGSRDNAELARPLVFSWSSTLSEDGPGLKFLVEHGKKLLPENYSSRITTESRGPDLFFFMGQSNSSSLSVQSTFFKEKPRFCVVLQFPA